jgi:hypothetical protein
VVHELAEGNLEDFERKPWKETFGGNLAPRKLARVKSG